MILTLLSPSLSAVMAALVYMHGLRRQKQNSRLCENPAWAARFDELRPNALRRGRRLMVVEAAYLIFVLTLAGTGLNHEPAGASFVTLVLALANAGAVALLAITFMAVVPCRRHLVLPPLLIVVFGAVYPILN